MINIPNTVSENDREEWLLADYLIKKVTMKASGAADNECCYNYPRDVYFIGNLRPRDDSEGSLSSRDLMQKLAPSAFGSEFVLDGVRNVITINVELSWDCFYRTFPTYQQQREWLRSRTNEDVVQNEENTNTDQDIQGEETDETLNISPSDRQDERMPREDLFIRFKKVHSVTNGIIVLNKSRVDNSWSIDTSDVENNLNVTFLQLYTTINSDPERIRLRNATQLFTLPGEALNSIEQFNQFLNGLRVEVDPRWNWEIICEVSLRGDITNEIVLLIQFVNASSFNEADKSREPYIFNSELKFQFENDVVKPFELELAPKSFRYNRNLWGRGFNCGLEKISDTIYLTTHTPIYTQFRYKTRNDPPARFEDLATDPIPVLRTILKSMQDYLETWDEQEIIFQNEFGTLWNQYSEEYHLDRRKFEEEIKRYEDGLYLVENDQDILLAFKLANEAFRRAGIDRNGNPKKDRWRLFQIVFLVIQLPGIAALNPKYIQYVNDREFVDIIYFPTGGGKTEAYLAVLIFHCFYDRLRGKTAGVTCWIRFPLRLLTIQQTQRIADIIGISELVRSEQIDKRLSGDKIYPFSVGYFVGAEATPNDLKPPENGRGMDPNWSIAIDPRERQRWKRVVTCPSCKTNTVSVDFDEAAVRVIHRCSNKGCSFRKGVIPVYVIDNEIYRYLPTIMVGTIDKLASIGFQRKLSMVFGKVDGSCHDHGFYNDRCCQKECSNGSKLEPLKPQGISGPTLFLQDELHLLREGLGTFDSHYETFSQYLLKEAGATLPLKIIASSATIERYERQVEHLYGKSPTLARVFPGIGPTLRKSFYAQTEDYPQRIFVGILPHNKTIFNAILEILEYYHRNIQLLSNGTISNNPYEGRIVPSTEEWNRLLDLFYTSLSYFLSSRDLDSLKTDIESHINNFKFVNEGLMPIEIKQLTGGTSTDDVTKILEGLEKLHQPGEPHEAVLATNMVSHGVDIDRFNCMIFYGIPRQNAEYIQSSSRIGRSHIGIVFNCFHPIRERDQSHYSYFTKYHEFLGQMVEPVAINRWSAYGINKTLPGLFMGTLLQILSNREHNVRRNSYFMLSKISKMYSDRELDKEEIIQILKDAYKANIVDDERNELFDERIEEAVNLYFDNITNPGIDKTFVSDALFPKPMRSLRDIDEPIEIELDHLGSQWGNTI